MKVEVVAGVAAGAVWETVEREEEHEGAVDVFGVEDVQQLAQVAGLAGFIADLLAVQSDRPAGVLVELDDLHGASAPVAGAAVGGAAELGDRDRLSLGFPVGDEAAHALAELVGDLGRPVEVDAGLVVPTGSLAHLLRTTLAPLVPALDAAEQ